MLLSILLVFIIMCLYTYCSLCLEYRYLPLHFFAVFKM